MAKKEYESIRIAGKTYYIRAEFPYKLSAEQCANDYRARGAFRGVRLVKRGKTYAVAVLLKSGFRPYRGEAGSAQNFSTNGIAIRKHGSGKSLTGECLKCGCTGIKPKHILKRKHWVTQWKCPCCGYTAEKKDDYL